MDVAGGDGVEKDDEAAGEGVVAGVVDVDWRGDDITGVEGVVID